MSVDAPAVPRAADTSGPMLPAAPQRRQTVYLPKDPEPVVWDRSAAFDAPTDVAERAAATPPAPTTPEEITAHADALDREERQVRSRDSEQRVSLIKGLREKWGDKYDANIYEIRSTIGAMLNERQADALMNARMTDGTALLNTPRGIEQAMRLVEINKYRREDRARYMRDDVIQREERQLIRSLMKAGNISDAPY